jgi:hypothetical protein
MLAGPMSRRRSSSVLLACARGQAMDLGLYEVLTVRLAPKAMQFH